MSFLIITSIINFLNWRKFDSFKSATYSCPIIFSMLSKTAFRGWERHFPFLLIG
jgi:hypothetical protein